MKRDPKLLIIAIPFMLLIFGFYNKLNKEAEEDFNRKVSMEEPAPVSTAAPYHIDAGGSRTLSKSVNSKGTVTYSVDIDSSEGYIYLYDKNGRIADSVHYTRADMPVSRSADIKKGECTLEVTRTPSSNGTGDMNAKMEFTPDRRAVQDKMTAGILIVTVIGTALVLVAPKHRGSRGRLIDGDLVMKDGYVTEEYKTPFDRITDFLEIYKRH